MILSGHGAPRPSTCPLHLHCRVLLHSEVPVPGVGLAAAWLLAEGCSRLSTPKHPHLPSHSPASLCGLIGDKTAVWNEVQVLSTPVSGDGTGLCPSEMAPPSAVLSLSRALYLLLPNPLFWAPPMCKCSLGLP